VHTATDRAVSGEEEERDAHRRALRVLQERGFEPMVGGAYALKTHTGIWRDTKDLDLFLRKDRIRGALAALKTEGFRTEFTDPLWIAKAFAGPYFIDLIFSSGNGIAVVDEHWRRRALSAQVLDREALVVPAEEMIWSKSFIMERERFDGADVAHILLARGPRLDWTRLVARFGEHWRILLAHMVVFGFVYPSERDRLPSGVLRELLGRLEKELDSPPPAARSCQGTILSRAQYLVDLERWGYRDARRAPAGNMTRAEIAHWTAAIEES
jgi:nucleotidyltransferase DUF2204